MQRRKFIKHAGAAMAGSVLLSSAGVGRTLISPNDKINVGVIGCNGMGWSNTISLLKMNDVDLVGICDVDQQVITRRAADYAALRSNKPKTYTDYRELLNSKDIDVVVIGTPDHWHCKMMVAPVNA